MESSSMMCLINFTKEPMKKIVYVLLFFQIFLNHSYSQNTAVDMNSLMVSVTSSVEFFTYQGSWGTEEVNAPAVKFILKVTNRGLNAVPDLAVSNRSQYVNFIINDSINNPLSLYNGLEATGKHLLNQGESDTYEWWIFTKDEAYGELFTVQWQYLGKYSQKHRVNMKTKSVVITE
jgi:hypothetical protein